jgi:hypothetical protein
MALVSVKQGHKDAAFFTANPDLILLDGQILWLKDNSGTFKKGDGVTALSALPFLGGGSAQSLAQTTAIGATTTDAITLKGLTDDLPKIIISPNDLGGGEITLRNSDDESTIDIDGQNGTISLNGVSVATVNDVNNAIIGMLDDRGNYDASVNLFPSSGGSGTLGAILKGDLWTISVNGTLGSVAVTIGDVVRCLSDAPGQTSSNWTITENNLGYVPENASNKVTSVAGNTTSNTVYASVKAIYDWSIGLFVTANTAITGATKTKVTYDSKGLVTSGADATTVDFADSTNKRYQTDNQQTYNDATSSIQTQLNGKQATGSYEATTNKGATGGYVGLTLFNINFKNALNTFTSFFTNSNTATRTYTFPDATGTVALTSDITGTNSGTNTGDETSARLASLGHAATSKSVLVDADELTGQDSANSWSYIKTTLANIFTYIQKKFETTTNGGNAAYNILAADNFIVTGTVLTAPRIWTLPSAASVNAGNEKTIDDAIGTITSTNTITIAVQSGEYLNNVLNGTEVMSSANAHRRFIAASSTNWTFDAGVVRLGATQTLTNKTLTNAIVGTQAPGDNSAKAASTAYADAISALCVKVANNLSDLANFITARNNLKEWDMMITTGDQTTTSNVASSITDLVFTPTINKRYSFEGVIHVGCNNTGGVKIQVTLPAGATIYLSYLGFTTSGTAGLFNAITASATLSSATCQVNSPNGFFKISGEVQMSSTASNIQFGFASGTNTQTSTIYQLGTQITVKQLN